MLATELDVANSKEGRCYENAKDIWEVVEEKKRKKASWELRKIWEEKKVLGYLGYTDFFFNQQSFAAQVSPLLQQRAARKRACHVAQATTEKIIKITFI